MRRARRTVLFGMALASANALAASPAELRVTGVIRPGACVPSFAADAEVNFGVIPSSAFKNKKRLALPAKQFRFSIACDVRTRVGVSPYDNQRHSADRNIGADLGEAEPAAPEDVFGLGSDLGHDLGGYEARFVPGTFTADGHDVDTISAAANGTSWIRRRGGQIRHGVVNAWAERGALTPAPIGNLSGMLRIRPVVNAIGEVKQDANLDGSLTLELHYL
ncbi:DUF1120 domain-containing protein [Herbaspirillum sp. LeCh32-8]|uniref:DUF1120 domain-containing protein n=1 Tax=Herbaspirillum sp. LeCh32-8 TaxID=2821356 RepID=UPI001AEA9A8F|nr:DUF1120 domain-containing protein [Herbaspirillum sp. LeCh32-8]MBP0598526.1 DUF1120 domain-containing protein [Herbaspirillum sp. LeCh32-8]